MSLVEKAKLITNPRAARFALVVTDEEIELAIAWARGEVTHQQVAMVRGAKTGAHPGTYVFLARAFRAAIAREILVSALPAKPDQQTSSSLTGTVNSESPKEAERQS